MFLDWFLGTGPEGLWRALFYNSIRDDVPPPAGAPPASLLLFRRLGGLLKTHTQFVREWTKSPACAERYDRDPTTKPTPDRDAACRAAGGALVRTRSALIAECQHRRSSVFCLRNSTDNYTNLTTTHVLANTAGVVHRDGARRAVRSCRLILTRTNDCIASARAAMERRT